MSTMEGTIVQAEEKTSKKGKPYIRLEIDAGGNKAWWTGFCTLQPLSVGARAIFSVKRSGDSDIIDDYNIIEPGTGQSSTPQNPAMGTSGGSSPQLPSGKHFGSRDMWIATECIYQHWIARHPSNPDSDYVAMAVKESALMAIAINEAFKAYETGKPPVKEPAAVDNLDDDIPF